MKLEQSFEVAAPIEQVWQTLIDVEHVAPCLPGAAVTGRNEDGSYNGTFTVKIGPTTASYSGKLEMENIDEASHTATMQAQGTDKRGQGGAKATILSRLAPADGHGTRVEVVTDYHITGRLARFGRGGMIEDISERLLREFAKRLQSSLAAQPGHRGAAAEPGRAADTVVSQVPEPARPRPPEPRGRRSADARGTADGGRAAASRGRSASRRRRSWRRPERDADGGRAAAGRGGASAGRRAGGRPRSRRRARARGDGTEPSPRHRPRRHRPPPPPPPNRHRCAPPPPPAAAQTRPPLSHPPSRASRCRACRWWARSCGGGSSAIRLRPPPPGSPSCC